MSGRRRNPRDRRRRLLGQNFLVDQKALAELIESAQIFQDQLVVEVGAGRGNLTIPIAEAGARVIAIEKDRDWARLLRKEVAARSLTERVTVVTDDFRSVPLPESRYRVIASPPFGLSTAVLAHLLDDPQQGPWRADLLLQLEVARKHAHKPPNRLRTAAWAPWWEFELGMPVSRYAFRPVPKVDAAVLTIHRRDPPVLPYWLAPDMRGLLRPVWGRSSRG